ncbi:MAG: aminoacyl-tRNA hydrolase [Planctomycetes bacterium]|nr:aminoacyl-tRNA hydrolase [Planctomycetota bacterium]
MTARSFDIDRLSLWIDVHFTRASGPGGQNVNKLNTRVTLLLDFESCPEFSADQRGRLRRKLATRLSRDGRLRVVSQRERTQAANRRLAEERLGELLAEALQRRRPRRPTRPTAAARERRLRAKRQQAERKRQRGKVDDN